jgi:hypothetical protein
MFQLLETGLVLVLQVQVATTSIWIAATERERRQNCKCVKTQILPSWMCLHMPKSEEEVDADDIETQESEVEDSEEEVDE